MSNSTEHLPADHQNPVKGSEVFVGGLAQTVTENKIREVFSDCGKIVEIRLIQDKSGNPKGFGFVRFAKKEAAEKAVKEKSGYVIEGRKIGVLPSIEQDTLYFGNLSKGWSAEEFENLVHQVFPDVVSVNLVMHGDLQPGQKTRNRGFAFVKFSSHAAASRAYRLGSSSEFHLGNLHPAIQWAEEEPEIDQNELAKIKIAFVRNLPSEADENYLKELFERYGKVERVVLPRKGNSLVGFVHFEKRLDLDTAIKELNEKTVQGPYGGPPFTLQVEVARPMDKSRKRVRDEPQSMLSSRIQHNSKLLKDEPKGIEVSDPYEAAIVALPSVINERLLRIMRLGIATRYDISIQNLTHLKELPESIAISILDQFMLSGAEVENKGAYLDELVAKYVKVGKNWIPSSVSRIENATLKEPETVRYSKQVRLPVDSYSPHVASPVSRSGIYTDTYSPTFPHHLLQSRVTTRLEETCPPLPIRSSTSAAYGRLGPTIYSNEQTSPPMQRPLSSAAYGRVIAATLKGVEEASTCVQQVPPSSASTWRILAALGVEQASSRLQVPPNSASAYERAVVALGGAEEASAHLRVPPSSASAYERAATTLTKTKDPRLRVPSGSAAAYGRAVVAFGAEEGNSHPWVPPSTVTAYGRAIATLKGSEEARDPCLRVPTSSAAAYGRAVAALGGAEEGSAHLRVLPSSASAYERAVAALKGGAKEGSPNLRVPPSSAAAYGREVLNSYPTNDANRQPTWAQVRFDPYTGKPYKFDPFTGEPILPE